MRRIAFRGQSSNGEWHYGMPQFVRRKYAIIVPQGITYAVHSLEEYTGLKDGNDESIFEHDVLETTYIEEKKAYWVFFEDGKFRALDLVTKCAHDLHDVLIENKGHLYIRNRHYNPAGSNTFQFA